MNSCWNYKSSSFLFNYAKTTLGFDELWISLIELLQICNCSSCFLIIRVKFSWVCYRAFTDLNSSKNWLIWDGKTSWCVSRVSCGCWISCLGRSSSKFFWLYSIINLLISSRYFWIIIFNCLTSCWWFSFNPESSFGFTKLEFNFSNIYCWILVWFETNCNFLFFKASSRSFWWRA